MKCTILSKVKDNGKFKLSKRSRVTYTKNKKVEYKVSTGGSVTKGRSVIVVTSNCSGRSLEKKGKTKVWID